MSWIIYLVAKIWNKLDLIQITENFMPNYRKWDLEKINWQVDSFYSVFIDERANLHNCNN